MSNEFKQTQNQTHNRQSQSQDSAPNKLDTENNQTELERRNSVANTQGAGIPKKFPNPEPDAKTYKQQVSTSEDAFEKDEKGKGIQKSGNNQRVV